MRGNYYATLGPACEKEDILRKMFEQGMTGIRLNLSHANLEQSKQQIATYFRAAEGIVQTPELLIDLQGPELRIGRLEKPLALKEGEKILLSSMKDVMQKEFIPVQQEVLLEICENQQLMLDDGKLLLEVEQIYDYENLTDEDKKSGASKRVLCRVLRGGVLQSGKSIAIKDATISLPTLTTEDLSNIAVAKKYGVTAVMLPFVRSAQDLKNLRKALDDADAKSIKIFAKIENQEGVSRLEELLSDCDEIVIARGDLGNSLPLWDLPVLQDMIAGICKKHGKPFMVVTQMLASMEHQAVPTRAEVSDIYHAIAQGAASVMLTAETAVGKYPVEAMEYLVKTAEAARKYCEV